MGYNFEPEYREIGSWEPDMFYGSGFPVRMPASVKLAAGQDLKRGSLLGKKPNGEYVLCSAITKGVDADGNEIDVPVEDGSEKPTRVLSVDAKTENTPRQVAAYRTGSYFRDALHIGEGHELSDVEDFLESRSIYIEEATD